MANPFREDIIALVTNNPNTFTYEEIGKKFGITSESVRNVARNNKQIFPLFRKTSTGGIIKESDSPISSLTQESKMLEPSQEQRSNIEALLKKEGYDPSLWRLVWAHLKDEQGRKHTVLLKNGEAIIQDRKHIDEFFNRLRTESPVFKPHKAVHKRALIPANFDVHIGKFCEAIRTDRTYTPEIAVQRVMQGHAELYELARPMGITDIILPLGNDLIHVDSNKYTTTNGTPQDAYGSVESMSLLAIEMYVRIIEKLAENHHVWLAHVSSNHDRLAGWFVSQAIASRFWNDKRVHFNRKTMANTHRKYFQYGRNLIMFQHGDSKVNDVLGTINAEVRHMLSATDFTYCYQGDKHHKMTYKLGEDGKVEVREKDYNGVTIVKSQKGRPHTVHVETVRSPSEADYWHVGGNYMNIPAVEAFVHDVNLGQIARFTHWF